jgi:RimJ/RimL family protein N-acetyltransferase
MIELVELETERLCLRQWRPQDREPFAELNADPWAVEKRDTKEFIGFAGMHIPIAELPFSPCVEIGSRLAFRYWGKGFATEAAKTCLYLGFGLLGLSEIVSFTTVRNLRSWAGYGKASPLPLMTSVNRADPNNNSRELLPLWTSLSKFRYISLETKKQTLRSTRLEKYSKPCDF